MSSPATSSDNTFTISPTITLAIILSKALDLGKSWPSAYKKTSMNVVPPSSNAATSISLELYNDVSEFEITFFFQVSQYSGTKEYFALTNAVQVRIKFQSFNL